MLYEYIANDQHLRMDIYNDFKKNKYNNGGGLADLPENPNNDAISYKRGGHVSKGELVWKKLSSSDKINFLYKNFTPQITPRSQEILVGKAFNFLPKNVKIKMESEYANVEEYANGGGLANVPESFPSNDAVSYKTGGKVGSEIIIKSGNNGNLKVIYRAIKNQRTELNANEVFEQEKIKGKSVFLFVNDKLYDEFIADSDEDEYKNGGSTKSFEYTIGGL